jgi:hypothetical protein
LRWADLALVPLAVGVILQLRRWWVGHPLWLDEEMIAINVRDTGFVTLTGRLLFSQSAPLGWLWAERTAVLAFGTDERAVRLLPLVFALGTLVLAWLCARRWLGPVGAVTVVTLLAVSPELARYAVEVKQYSADAFCVLLLVAGAALVLDSSAPLRPLVAWWSLAAVSGWFSMAAVFVVPSLAVVLLATLARRHGRGVAVRGALFGTVWLAAFAVHYLASLRYTTTGTTLRGFWVDRGGLPPDGSGIAERFGWLAGRLSELAADPLWLAGDATIAGFWALALAGAVVAVWRRGPAGLLLVGPVATGVALGFAGVVPLADRLALWLLPILAFCVAVAVDALARSAGSLASPPDTPGAAVSGRRLRALLAGSVALAVVAGAVGPLREQVSASAAPPSNVDRTDDRAAIAWLVDRHQPGDLTLVSVGSTPAVRWYAPGGQLRPGWYARRVEAGPSCAPAQFRDALRGHQRVLVYSIDIGGGTDTHRALTAELGALGRRVDGQDFDMGRVWIVELDPATLDAPGSSSATGCLRLNQLF